jgi:hypothetical protein
MAAGRLAAPGSQYGPCIEKCAHIDCNQTRADADAECPICRKPIGYDTRFYQFRWTSPGGAPFDALGHAVCVEDHYEQERATAPTP